MSDQISDENMLTNEEKTKLEQELAQLKKELEQKDEKSKTELEALRKEIEQRRTFDPMLDKLAKQLPLLKQLEKQLKGKKKIGVLGA